MSYATLMVYVDIDGVPEQRVRIASGLAAKFDAALIGFSAHAIPMSFFSDEAIKGLTTEDDIKKMQKAFAKKESWFRSIVGADCREIEWRTTPELPCGALAREASCADLVIIERQQARGRHNKHRTLDPGEALLELGRPALIVAPGVASLRAEHIVVAWKNTREARRAMLDAIPFLRAAKRVSVVEICSGDEEKNAMARIDGVIRYLARHRITADPRPILHYDKSEADQLMQFALNEDADLLVLGAYGHSRLGEWIYGGMTQDILASCPICCLMSH